MENFRLADIEKLISENFELEIIDLIAEQQSQPVVFNAKLRELKLSSCHGEEFEAFKVLFDVPDGNHLRDADYKIKHESIGEVTLYGSPNSPHEVEFICAYDRNNLS